MRVIVNKNSLEEAIKILLEKSEQEERIDILSSESEDPIIPVDQMSVQLSADAPPVQDVDYVPANSNELSRSAAVIAAEVPADQLDFFYRKLHNLLDSALDNSDELESEDEPSIEKEQQEDAEVEEENVVPYDEDDLSESIVQKIRSILLEQTDLEIEDETSDDAPGSDEAADTGGMISDPIDNIIADIADLEIKVRNAKQTATLSMNDKSAERLEADFGWMFYPSDQSHIGLPWMIIKAVKRPEVQVSFEDAKRELQVDDQTLVKRVIQKYRSLQPPQSPPLSQNPVLAAEMYSNVMADKMPDPDVDVAGFNQAVDDLMDKVQASGSITASFSEKTGEPPLKINVPANIFLTALQKVKDQRLDKLKPDIAPEPEEDVDISLLKRQYKERERSDRQKIADDLGISYGALTNVEQDMAVALGPRGKGAHQRAPGTADEEKLSMYKIIYDSILEKLISLAATNLVRPIFISRQDIDPKSLTPQQEKTIDSASNRIASEIFGYNSEEMKFSNSETKEIFDEFLVDFVRTVDKDVSSPLFDALPDYADFKTGDGEFIGRDDFTTKDMRETSSTAKNLAYLIRNIFNVGYELKARATTIKMQARKVAQQGDIARARNMRAESEEYASESLKYMTRSKEIIDAIAATEISEKFIKKYSNKLNDLVRMSYK